MIPLMAEHISNRALGASRQAASCSLRRCIQVSSRMDSLQNAQVISEVFDELASFVRVVLWLNLDWSIKTF